MDDADELFVFIRSVLTFDRRVLGLCKSPYATRSLLLSSIWSCNSPLSTSSDLLDSSLITVVSSGFVHLESDDGQKSSILLAIMFIWTSSDSFGWLLLTCFELALAVFGLYHQFKTKCQYMKAAATRHDTQWATQLEPWFDCHRFIWPEVAEVQVDRRNLPLCLVHYILGIFGGILMLVQS